jgi:hypothetical protein
MVPQILNIANVHSFQCICVLDDDFKHTEAWHTACLLTDQLNDLVEEYNAPGNQRKELRSISQNFHRTLKKLLRHRTKYNLEVRWSTDKI